MKSATERFFSHVNKTATCWLWTGKKDYGYGRFWLNGKTIRAHHFLMPPKPSGAVAMHSCDNRACVNPEHLRWGTSAENFQDSIAKGRGNQRPGWEAMMKVRRIHLGESNRASKLTSKQVIEIRSTRIVLGTMAEMANCYGVSHETIRAVLGRRTWRHL